jgi:hypothetical protein
MDPWEEAAMCDSVWQITLSLLLLQITSANHAPSLTEQLLLCACVWQQAEQGAWDWSK